MPTTIANTESRTAVNELLKKVDSLVKSNELDQAREQILRAKEFDPRNMYVHAYLERVDLLMEQRKRNREAAEAKKLAEEAARIKAEAERRRREEEQAARLREYEEERKKKEEESRKREEERRAREEERRRDINHLEEVSSYNRALFEAWTNGAPSPQQQQFLDTLRFSLHISPEEHSGLAPAVRRECYIQAFRRLWSSDNNDAWEGPSTITTLRKKFQIGIEEFDSIESQLLSQLKRPKTGPLVIIVDDDQDVLNALSAVLQDAGYDARGFTTSDEAYRFLMHTTPELILSDINLETSTLGGFAFFEKIQELPRLSHVPFVFISGITDDIIVRTGKEMGADDYLPKPFDNEKLLSVVKGKIRRYQELRGITSN